jgi:Ca2+-transporting ATPase
VLSNKYLILAVLSSVLMLLGIIYLPFLSAVFGTTALALNEWLIAGGISLLVPILVGVFGARKPGLPQEHEQDQN